ncbi:acyl-CoA dehydrogenase family protein [Nonomuraea sp. NPDC049400]|uniref:acyl-CoA dehydrogenase family protein n=1 Tax=Nonomuraea sp. NPDC049400 TaxID=3364352 RepID=UPI0037A54CE0
MNLADGPARLARLEHEFGDPFEPGNPLGFAPVLAADEAGTPFGPGEDTLAEFGLNAEFVPSRLGGRLDRLDDLVQIMRAIYRRDPCMGLGYGASSFIAGVNIWAAGTPEQQQSAADLLRSGQRIAVAYHELAHGNDMAGTECRADCQAGRITLNGRKEVVTNLQRSEAFVLFARTSAQPGPRSHSPLLISKGSLDPRRFRYLPRFATMGMRGVQLGGIEFRDCPAPESALLGQLGHGMEIALRSFQITRTTLVSMFCGILDTGLRTAIRHTTRRRLYGGPVIAMPHVRSVIAGAYADLLAADCFASVATRALHLLPAQTPVYAQAVKFFTSKILIDAMNDLSHVLGAHFYIRDGEAAIFAKLLRDIQPAGFGHAARAACQVSLLSQLPLLARRGWAEPAAVPDELFAIRPALPELSLADLAISAAGREGLSGALAAGLAASPAGTLHEDVAQHAGYFAAEHRLLTAQCRDLGIDSLGIMADPRSYDLVTRYVRVLVASACFETWRRTSSTGDGASDPAAFIADQRWLAAVLHRLRAAARNRPASLPPELADFLVHEAADRLDRRQGLGLAAPVCL